MKATKREMPNGSERSLKCVGLLADKDRRKTGFGENVYNNFLAWTVWTLVTQLGLNFLSLLERKRKN